MERESPRASYFKKARRERYAEVAEDYTEMIADYLEDRGVVRVCDIAREMGVSHVNVLKTLKKLMREGLLCEDMSLTDRGREMAAYSKRKHEALMRLLLELGVSEEVAAADVEGIEHHISRPTLEAIEAHLNRGNR